MKKIGVSVLIIMFAIGLAGNFQLAEAKSDKSIVLRMSSPWPERGLIPEMTKWWGSEVEKRTNGKIKIQYYWGGMLGTIKENFYTLERGVCDIAVMAPYIFEEELPLSMVGTCLVGTFENDPIVTSNAWRQMTKEFPQMLREWENSNQKLLIGWETGPYLWLSKNPIKSFKDFKGKKTGLTGGKSARELYKELGSIPISISPVKVYDALNKGTMEFRPATTHMVTRYKYYEAAKYLTDVGRGCLGSPVYAMAINLDKWNSLPSSLQEIILDVNKDWWDNFEKVIKGSLNENREFLTKNGVTFTDFSQEDKTKFQTLPVYKIYKQKFIERVKNAGYSSQLGEKMYNRYRELIEKGGKN